MPESDRPVKSKSSYDLIDHDSFWNALPVTPGMTVLDLGCGSGRYTLPLSARVGPAGHIIAVDQQAALIDLLREELAGAGITNVAAHVAQAEALPLGPATLDLCLMATVLHHFTADACASGVLAQVARLLKPRGILAVVEFIKQEGPPGPPKNVRLSLGEVTALVQPFGLIRFGGVIELGAHLYYAHFQRLGATARINPPPTKSPQV